MDPFNLPLVLLGLLAVVAGTPFRTLGQPVSRIQKISAADDVPAAAAGSGRHHRRDGVQLFLTDDGDRQGVGRLVRIAAQDGRAVRPDLKLGVCGEHGGDPESIQLFYEAGLDYVSCSPFRVPIARLAAAQDVIGGATTSTK